MHLLTDSANNNNRLSQPVVEEEGHLVGELMINFTDTTLFTKVKCRQ